MRNCSGSLIMTVDGIVTTMVAAELVGLQARLPPRLGASRPEASGRAARTPLSDSLRNDEVKDE
jgi:hypothetical protein